MTYKIIGRGLTPDEVTLCLDVFSPSLSRQFLETKVMLHNGLGAGDRPFTSIDIGLGRYEIYIGPGAFDATTRTTDDFKSLLIHEMTHVWQMHVRSWFGAVWCNSLINQFCHGTKSTYNYGEGNLNKPWNYFNVEQQASIVEHWYDSKKGKQSPTDPRFHYIRDNVRPGKG